MNVVKLLNLAELLRRNAADENGMKFDLSFVNRVAQGQLFGRNCGTAGCAVGLACVSDEFPELQPQNGRDVLLRGERRSWDRAAGEVFGIDMELVGLLFLDTSYDGEHRRGAAGELAVAERIEQVVKDYQSSN